MAKVRADRQSLAAFCRDRHIRGLALLGIARTERELSAIFEGRKADLRTAEDLSR